MRPAAGAATGEAAPSPGNSVVCILGSPFLGSALAFTPSRIRAGQAWFRRADGNGTRLAAALANQHAALTWVNMRSHWVLSSSFAGTGREETEPHNGRPTATRNG